MSKVILFRGKAGVGKTTISSEVARLLKLPIIHKDDIYDIIAEMEEDHRERNKTSEKIIRKLITRSINNDVDIVLDHSCHYKNQIHEFRDWLTSQGGQLTSILITCSDEEIWKERFNKRKLNPQPNNIITDFEDLKNHYGQLYTEPMEGELILDSVNELKGLVGEAIDFVSPLLTKRQ